MTGIVALTERLVRSSFRNLDIVFAVLAPILTFVGFTVALRSVIDTGGISYPQYVLPASPPASVPLNSGYAYGRSPSRPTHP